MGLLEGDTALITGAASGIGRGIAKALVAEGVRPVLSDVAVEAGRALAREMNATFIPADLADPTAPRKLFDAAEKSLGFVSILVHSASPRRRENETALAVTESEWDSMVTVGLRAGFVLGQAAGAQMQARKIKGRMLFITSLHAHTPRNLPHLQRDKSRPNDDRKRTCARPWSRRDSRERHSARRYTGRRFRRRYHSPPKDDSIRPNGNAGRHRRHGRSSPMRSLFSVRNGDYGCGGWWTLALQLDSVPDSRLEANENPASDTWCGCSRSRACGYRNIL